MTEIQDQPTLWISRDQLAQRLGLDKATLAHWAVVRQGPAFKKFGGRVRYRLDVVEAWEEAQPAGGETE